MFGKFKVKDSKIKEYIKKLELVDIKYFGELSKKDVSGTEN